MDMERMDDEVNRILDILEANEFSLAENIAIITKVLAVLLKYEEQKIKTEEEKEILQKARKKIATYIIGETYG